MLRFEEAVGCSFNCAHPKLDLWRTHHLLGLLMHIPVVGEGVRSL